MTGGQLSPAIRNEAWGGHKILPNDGNDQVVDVEYPMGHHAVATGEVDETAAVTLAHLRNPLVPRARRRAQTRPPVPERPSEPASMMLLVEASRIFRKNRTVRYPHALATGRAPSLDQAHTKAFFAPFVAHNWRVLAGTAWRGYVGRGRGAVTMDLGTVRRWIDGGRLVLEPTYITASTSAEVEQLIAAYEPHSSIVVVFCAVNDDTWPSDASTSAWVFSHSPAPPQLTSP